MRTFQRNRLLTPFSTPLFLPFDKIAAHLGDKEDEKGICMRMPPAHAACSSLGQLKDAKALPLLVAKLDDPIVADQAAQAMGAITGLGANWTPADWKDWWAKSTNK